MSCCLGDFICACIIFLRLTMFLVLHEGNNLSNVKIMMFVIGDRNI